MSLLTENVTTLAKVETTYGTDAVPTGADALVTTQVKLTPLEQTTVSRDLDKANSGSDQELTADFYAMIEFSVELVGSGAIGTAPAFGKLLRACRCQENITATTSVIYRPFRASTTSLTFAFYLDGNLHKLLGARGTFTIEVNSQGIPYLKFRFTGLWVQPSAGAAPAPVGWSDFQIPTVVNYDNTPTPTLHGYTGVLKRFTFDAGCEVKVFNNPGEREVRITAHKARGNITMLAPPIGTINFFDRARLNTLGTMKVQHGTASTTRWYFEATGSTCQILKPNYGDDDGRATIEAELLYVPTAVGGDEWELRFAAT
jgi:hypothetical protein